MSQKTSSIRLNPINVSRETFWQQPCFYRFYLLLFSCLLYSIFHLIVFAASFIACVTLLPMLSFITSLPLSITAFITLPFFITFITFLLLSQIVKHYSSFLFLFHVKHISWLVWIFLAEFLWRFAIFRALLCLYSELHSIFEDYIVSRETFIYIIVNVCYKFFLSFLGVAFYYRFCVFIVSRETLMQEKQQIAPNFSQSPTDKEISHFSTIFST